MYNNETFFILSKEVKDMIRNFLSILLVIIVGFGIVITDAEAKRFGGGRSFGTYRSANSFSRAQPAASAIKNTTAQSGMSRWLGPLAGLAAGGLLASLFMGNGFGSGIMSWLLIAGAIMLLVNLVRGFSRNKMQHAAQSSNYQIFRDNAARETQFSPHAFSSSNSSMNYPAGFDETEFLRDAKVQFYRLQTAYDAKNLNDINQFTTPEVFAEIKMQLQEMGNVTNQTDVVSLDAKLLDAATEYQIVLNNEEKVTVASVHFSGLIKEEANQPATQVNEIWHFRKDTSLPRWVVSGIQQYHQ